jgi:F-type H+-transporting ATPase subunit epsilon
MKNNIMELLHVDIISPYKRLEADVSLITLPGAEGVFGVMAGHMNLLASIVAGKVEMRRNDSDVDIIYVSAGSVQVSKEGCIVLVTEFASAPMEDIKMRLDIANDKLNATTHNTIIASLKEEIAFLNILSSLNKASMK